MSKYKQVSIQERKFSQGGLSGNLTPSDTEIQNINGIYIGEAGDLSVEMLEGQVKTFRNLPSGVTLWITVRKVLTTNTTAGSLIGLGKLFVYTGPLPDPGKFELEDDSGFILLEDGSYLLQES